VIVNLSDSSLHFEGLKGCEWYFEHVSLDHGMRQGSTPKVIFAFNIPPISSDWNESLH
jgi:hypothetical protein